MHFHLFSNNWRQNIFFLFAIKKMTVDSLAAADFFFFCCLIYFCMGAEFILFCAGQHYFILAAHVFGFSLATKFFTSSTTKICCFCWRPKILFPLAPEKNLQSSLFGWQKNFFCSQKIPWVSRGRGGGAKLTNTHTALFIYFAFVPTLPNTSWE